MFECLKKGNDVKLLKMNIFFFFEWMIKLNFLFGVCFWICYVIYDKIFGIIFVLSLLKFISRGFLYEFY